MEKQKTKLGLQLPTDPRWANIAGMQLEEILVDHAYCEQKAASTCISLIINHPERQKLVEELSPIVAEEWGHFRRVLGELKKRNFTLGTRRKDEYVNALLKFQRKGGGPDSQLMERLLTMALIEARSCERFRLLSLHIPQEELKSFYHDFMVSEAGHYRLFMNLSEHYCGKEATQKRWQEYLDFEAELLSKMEPRADRMH